MILRSLMKHVSQQNWVAVVIDFAIVVLGVVMGIQVTNWNDSRVEETRAKSYLAQIADDLDVDRARLAAELRLRAAVLKHGHKALAAEREPSESNDDWMTVLDFYEASQAGVLRIANTTYNELISTGDVRLIEDKEIRRALAEYYTQTELTGVVNELPIYRENVRGIIPAAWQAHIWDSCYDTTLDGELYGRLVDDCPKPEGTVELSDIAERLLNDGELIERLRYWVSAQRIITLVLNERMKAAVSLQEQLNLLSSD